MARTYIRKCWSELVSISMTIVNGLSFLSLRSLLFYQKECRYGFAILYWLLSNKSIRIPIKFGDAMLCYILVDKGGESVTTLRSWKMGPRVPSSLTKGHGDKDAS